MVGEEGVRFTGKKRPRSDPGRQREESCQSPATKQDRPRHTQTGQHKCDRSCACDNSSCQSSAVKIKNGGGQGASTFPSNKDCYPAPQASLLEGREDSAGKELIATQARRKLSISDHPPKVSCPFQGPAAEAVLVPNGLTASQRESQDAELIMIWDLDETLILFSSLLMGSFAEKRGKDRDQSVKLGEEMMNLILHVLDEYMFFNEIDCMDQEHISNIASFDDQLDLQGYDFRKDGLCQASRYDRDFFRKLSYRYRVVGEIYHSQASKVVDCLRPESEAFGRRKQLLHAIDEHTEGWLSTAWQSLQDLRKESRAANVLVTSSQLVPALVKNLVYEIDQHFPLGNIYSSATGGKMRVFEKIVKRFGKDKCYVAVGDGPEERDASHHLGIPFVKVNDAADLQEVARKALAGEWSQKG